MREDIKKVSVQNRIGPGSRRMSLDKFEDKYKDASERKRLIESGKVDFLDEYGGIIPVDDVWVILFGEEISTYPLIENPTTKNPCVFISYNSSDRDAAITLKNDLEANEILVLIDEDVIDFKMPIDQYIREQIDECDFMICLISTRIFSSGWVGLEIFEALNKSQSLGNNILIGCALDNDWMKPFHEHAPILDSQIKALVAEQEENRKHDPHDESLVDDIGRLRNFRKRLPSILRTLRKFRIEDFSSDNWDTAVSKICESIKLGL